MRRCPCKEVRDMTVSALMSMLGPELILLVGACATLMFGGSREKGSS